MLKLTFHEVMRSLALYNLAFEVYSRGQGESPEKLLVLAKEPILPQPRNRPNIGKIVVAMGSYDPLTIAHERLFLAGLENIGDIKATRGKNTIDELLILTATTHVDKKIDLSQNSSLPDRIHAQEGFADAYGNVSLGFVNTPLFVDMMPLIEKTYGEGIDIYFLVGTDVMEKIVDKKYYNNSLDDVAVAIGKLFKHRFIVADRKYETATGDSKIVTVADIVSQNAILEPYDNRLIAVSLDQSGLELEIPITDVSSSLVRDKRSRGETPTKLEAVGISEFVVNRALYLDSNLYEASICATQMAADKARKTGAPIASYIYELMDTLFKLQSDSTLRKDVVAQYKEHRLL